MNHRISNQLKIWLLMFLLMMIVPTACTSNLRAEMSQPIASYPKQTPIAVAPPLPEQAILVYQAFLELQVENVDAISSRAQELSYRYGGYLVSTQSWYVDGQQNTSIVLAIPTANFERMYQELSMLGDPVSETISAELVQTYPRSLVPFSHITLHLRSLPRRYPVINITNSWDPIRTFRNASSVFLRVFGFIADVVIWLVVVAGPFVLIVWLAAWIIRRMRLSRDTPKPE